MQKYYGTRYRVVQHVDEEMSKESRFSICRVRKLYRDVCISVHYMSRQIMEHSNLHINRGETFSFLRLGHCNKQVKHTFRVKRLPICLSYTCSFLSRKRKGPLFKVRTTIGWYFHYISAFILLEFQKCSLKLCYNIVEKTSLCSYGDSNFYTVNTFKTEIKFF